MTIIYKTIKNKHVFNIKKIYDPIIQFLCSLSEIIIIFIDIILDKFGISDGLSEYMERDREGIINSIVKSIIIFMSLIIFIVPMLVVVSWLFMEDKSIKR